jgi:hypothetical protein
LNGTQIEGSEHIHDFAPSKKILGRQRATEGRLIQSMLAEGGMVGNRDRWQLRKGWDANEPNEPEMLVDHRHWGSEEFKCG